ncbi:phosphatidylinositol 3- and 4-kinase family protein with FAT domain-containing protein [Artemisia annua]|uniref:Phosphatidylinositol 3-and 4-kinase family protein with FAT domain-containing protein n=1 Tax=Artemisia annua TaxID=35608 RepID=A0A2U1KDH4_ARTAN|nr:phosphatidylinositol 3- and 4-kinase family protein with FAT domain-containing protein [Artemisia annua]
MENYRLSLEVVGHNSNAFPQNNRLDQEKVHENSAISDTKNTINVEQVIGRINVIAPQFITEEDENSVDPPQSVQRGVTELEVLKKEISQRCKLNPGTCKLKYLDEDEEWILMTSDADIRYCISCWRPAFHEGSRPVIEESKKKRRMGIGEEARRAFEEEECG